MNRRFLLFVGAAMLIIVLAGVAYFLLRGPQVVDRPRLVAALDAFTGTWEGDASLQATNGQPLQTVRVSRDFSWIGEKQLVETRFKIGAEERVTRAIQWIDRRGLRAIETGPAGSAQNYTGALTLDGILWTNLEVPKADRLDRLVAEHGRRTVQSASIIPLGPGHSSEPVGVAAVLHPYDPVSHADSKATEATAAADVRAAELERELAAIIQERDALLTKLARAVAAEASALASAARTLEQPSRIEIRSSPPGMKFEIRAEDEKNMISDTILASGSTPVTLPDMPPGDYAVILQGTGPRKTVHHVTARANRDVFVFHRETDSADDAPAVARTPDDP